jgi:outer membrane protein
MNCIKLILISVLIFPSFLWGAQVLSFQNCIELALEKNTELKSAQSTFYSFENKEGAAKYNFFPQLSADIVNDRGENIGFLRSDSTESTSSYTKTNTYSALMTARQNVFNGLADSAGTDQAGANTKASGQGLIITKAKLSFDLKNSFEGLRFAKEYQKLTKQIIKRRKENLNIVELRYHNGMENKGSVLLSKATLQQAEYDNLVARNAERVSTAALARAVGLDEFADITIEGEVPISEPPATPDFKKLVPATPYFQQAFFQEEGAEAGKVVARSEFFPKFNIFATAGKQGDYLWPDKEKRWSLGFTLTLPFFNGGRDYYGTKSAVDTWAASVSNRIEVSRDVLQKLEKAYADFIEAVARYNVDFSFMEASKLRAEIARRKYNNGLLIFDDWTIIEDDYVRNSKTYLLSKRDRVIAEANWEYTQGKGVIP